MSAIGSYEAKTHLPQILKKVEKGERFTITRHGVPIAELIPVSAARRKTPEELIREVHRLRKGLKLKGLSIKEMVNKGRRF